MGLFDKAQEAAQEHSEEVEGAAEKVGEFVDEKTGGQFSDQIETGQEKLSEFLGNEGEEGAEGGGGGNQG